MPMGSEFNGPPMSNSLDPSRQGPPVMSTMGESKEQFSFIDREYNTNGVSK